MKHVTYGGKSLLMGNLAADTMLEYAALLARTQSADTVELKAVSTDGNDVVATFLLDTGAPLMAESAHSSMPEPDNSDVVAYMQTQIMRLSTAPPVPPADASMPGNYEDLNL